MVQAPSRFTLAAQEVRRLRSKSVAVMVNRSLAASNKKFERMGIVVLRSTTPWVAVSCFSSHSFHLAGVLVTIPGPYLLLLLIPNKKHIKPVVTAGSAEKWKFEEQSRYWRAGSAHLLYKTTVPLCGQKCLIGS